jgi:8-amino-7-oxononanoate synthase
LINFSSNDYLGLAADPRISQALAEGALAWGAGAGASRLVCGDFLPEHELEEELARFEGSEAALLFGSGYAANCGILPALAGPEDLILSDALNHASIIDGCRLSRARVEVYPHADLGAVERLLRGMARRKVVVTDAVFSMDGDRAPLRGLAALCAASGALLIVDEAHATGVIGPQGAGLAAEQGVSNDVRMATLSKAFGVAGAYAAASRAVCELLVNRARPLIFSTALPPALACAALASLRILSGPEGDQKRARLWDNIRRFATGLRAAGIEAREDSPIFPVMLGAPERAVAAASRLREQGFLVKAIRPPTVPPGTSRLRFALSAAHTDAHIDSALAALRAC